MKNSNPIVAFLTEVWASIRAFVMKHVVEFMFVGVLYLILIIIKIVKPSIIDDYVNPYLHEVGSSVVAFVMQCVECVRAWCCFL